MKNGDSVHSGMYLYASGRHPRANPLDRIGRNHGILPLSLGERGLNSGRCAGLQNHSVPVFRNTRHDHRIRLLKTCSVNTAQVFINGNNTGIVLVGAANAPAAVNPQVAPGKSIFVPKGSIVKVKQI